MTTSTLRPSKATLAVYRARVPGILTCAVVATAATSLSQHYGAPVMLLALLLGLAMSFLAAEERCASGIEFTARTVLRLGVALLGLQITASEIVKLGPQTLLLVVFSVVITISLSVLAARLLGFKGIFGLLTGGATAICGASAALALAAALPDHPLKERATLFTIVGISALSTMAMIFYPVIAQLALPDPRMSGIFLGATIHDVAQVVGAGYSMSRETGDVATLVKLMRVAMLLPVILAAGVVTRMQGATPGAKRPPLLPGFMIGFIVLVALNSVVSLPTGVLSIGRDASRWCLIAAVSALGMKTQLRQLAAVGLKPVLLMIGETAFLCIMVLMVLRYS
jgi:uncharacterized integral membrane protein (TIGR00698 family)